MLLEFREKCANLAHFRNKAIDTEKKESGLLDLAHDFELESFFFLFSHGEAPNKHHMNAVLYYTHFRKCWLELPLVVPFQDIAG